MEFTAVIEHGELSLDESGKASEVWTCRGGDVITRRLCVPPAGYSHDERSGPAETVMKGYVAANCVNPADADRTIDLVSNEADGGRGANVSMSARYEALADKLEEAARAGGIGWELVGTATGLEFRIVPGVDRSAAQSTNPPIIFSPDFGNLRTLGYQWSMLNRATLAYVAGQGEGADRAIREVYIDAAEPTGIARREAFIDARDLDDESKLVDRGTAKLSEQGPKERLEAQILTVGPFRYRQDWDLGDVVTVRNQDWDVLAHLRIAAVTVSLEAGSGEQIEVAFGAPPANLVTVIRQGIAASEVVQRSEGGGIGNPMTAAGDLIVGGTGGEPARLAKGTALQLLRVKSDESGLEWGLVTNANLADGSVTTPKLADGAVTMDKLADGVGDITCIGAITVGAGGAAFVEFSNIPQTYRALRLYSLSRTNRPSYDWDDVRACPNGDLTVANYTGQYLSGFGSSVSSGTTSIAGIFAGLSTASTAPAAAYSIGTLDIVDYAGSDKWKCGVAYSFTPTFNGSPMVTLRGGVWKQTAPVTSLRIVPHLGTNIAAGSVFILYGLG